MSEPALSASSVAQSETPEERDGRVLNVEPAMSGGRVVQVGPWQPTDHVSLVAAATSNAGGTNELDTL
jgi:hypothetical protein